MLENEHQRTRCTSANRLTLSPFQNVLNKLTWLSLTKVWQICILRCLSLRLRSIESLLFLLREDLEQQGVPLHFHIQCTSTDCPLKGAQRSNAYVTQQPATVWEPPFQLTALFAKDKEKLCSRLLHAHVDMCHEANQLVPDGAADLWPVLHILQWRKDLKQCRNVHFAQFTKFQKASSFTENVLFITVLCSLPELWGICGSPCGIWILQLKGWALVSNPLCSWSPAQRQTDHKHFRVFTSWSSGRQYMMV